MSVRRAALGDAAALADLRARSRLEAYGIGLGSDPSFDERFGRWLQQHLESGGVAWLAEADGSVVGMLVMVVHERMPEPGRRSGRWGYIGNVFVRPGHRDAGVGAALLTAVTEHARREGFDRLVLNPSPRSVPFYRRGGFSDDHALLTLNLDPS